MDSQRPPRDESREELERRLARLRAAWHDRNRFLRSAGHDLRTPLTAILGWTEVLAEDRPDAETAVRAMDQIRRSAEVLNRLVSDLLELSGLDEGGARLERVDTDLARLVREAVEPAAVVAAGRGVACSVVPPPDGSTVCVDPLRVRQVLWNLVCSAAKFTPRGGRIEVRALVEGEDAVFRVSDDGEAVEPADVPILFDRLLEADTRTRVHRGSGTSLAIAKAFAELHGGTISIGSAPGPGATFTVRIPARSPAETGAAKA